MIKTNNAKVEVLNEMLTKLLLIAHCRELHRPIILFRTNIEKINQTGRLLLNI